MPPNTYWESPGLPSIMVPYGRASDFYYSGHTGFFILVIREAWVGAKLDSPTGKPGRPNWMLIGALCGCLLYMMVLILLFKVHYSIGTFFLSRCTNRSYGCLDGPYDCSTLRRSFWKALQEPF